MMVVGVRYYTAQDLWELSHSPEYANMRLELSQGELIVMSPVSWKHGVAAIKAGKVILDFVEAHNLGLVTGAETGYILFSDESGRDTVRAPDVGFVAASRVPEELPDSGYVPFAPDLAIEIVSPNDKAHEIQEKVTEYLQYGTRQVWVAYPNSRQVVIHTAAGSHTFYADDLLDGSDVLPGFRVQARTLFR